MADGKWISGLAPKMPLVEAAQMVLPARFLVVLHHLPLAIAPAAKGPEHVHQLRVASRRAAAALKLFGSCLPRKRTKPLRQTLRALRRAAGDARDWDVFFDSMKDSPAFTGDEAAPARDFLLGVASGRRMVAQVSLTEIAEREGREFHKHTRNLIHGSFEWQLDNSALLGEQARHTITALFRELEDLANPPPTKYPELHELRILGKRLRYSMEVFATCFQDPFRERLYPAIEEMQEILGAVTDAHVASERIMAIREHLKGRHRDSWPRYQSAVEHLLQSQKRALPAGRKRFGAWLSAWRTLTAQLDLSALSRNA